MGLAGFSLGHMLVVLLVVVLVFGTKRLGSIGSDLGEAIKGFRKAMGSESDAPSQNQTSLQVDKENEKHV